MKKLILNILIISFVALVLQYIWEYVQCDIFYKVADNTGHKRLMLSATIGDILMSVFLYFLLAFTNQNVNWFIERWKRHDYIIMMLYALLLSFYFEINALYENRWQYQDAMPLFPNTPIGLVPILQLIILIPVIFYISKLILKNLGKVYSV
jgi:hypothetical protein